MAKKDADKIIADQAKEISALKAKVAAKEMAASKAVENQVNWTEELVGLQQKYADSLDASKEALGKSKDLSKEINELQKFMVDNAKDFNNEDKKYGKALIKNLKNQRDQAKILSKQLATNAKIAKIEQQMLPHRKKLLESQQKLNKLQEKYNEPIEESLGFIKNIANTIEEIPIVGGFLNKALGLDTLQEEVTEHLTEVFSKTLDPAAAKQAEEAKNALDAYQGQIDSLNGVSDATDMISENMEDVSTKTSETVNHASGLIKKFGKVLAIAGALYATFKLFEEALELDKETAELARQLGISKHEAHEIHASMIDMAGTSQVVGANAETLHAAFMELTKTMGTANMVTAEMADTQVLLTTQYGLAGDAAAEFQRMSKATGTSAEQNVVAIQSITEEMTGGMMNYKDVMKDIAGTSKEVQATFKGNIGQLTKAVITARKFGKTLDEVKKITDGLLDIEGSIEKEMEARVLTGKDLNLDQARFLKLKGDEAGAMEEIMKQAGSYDDLLNMEVYQRESIAAAAGMTVDELMKGAEQQKLFAQLSKDTGREIKSAADLREGDIANIGELNQEEAKKLLVQQQQVAAQEKMAQLGDKLSAIFLKMAGPVMAIVDPLISLVDWILPKVISLFEYLWPVVVGISTAIAVTMLPSLISMVPVIWSAVSGFVVMAVQAAIAAIGAIATMSALTLGLGAIGIVAGILAAAAVLNNEKDKTKSAGSIHDGMIAPDGGLVVSGEKGTYQLHKDDTVVAGTGLGNSTSAMTTQSTSAAGSDSTELISLMKQLISAVNQPVIVKIGNKVVNEIDKVQTMNRSYVGKVDNSYGAV